jgi:hypothetical protein
MMRNKISLIITCKGMKKNGKVEECQFLHDGNWGDGVIVSHQIYHESLQNKNSFWLGFETSLFIGKSSGRDGKQS